MHGPWRFYDEIFTDKNDLKILHCNNMFDLRTVKNKYLKYKIKQFFLSSKAISENSTTYVDLSFENSNTDVFFLPIRNFKT